MEYWALKSFQLFCWVILFTAQSAALNLAENQTAEDILASVKPEQVKSIVNKVADEVLGNFKVCCELFCCPTLKYFNDPIFLE